MSIPIPYRFLMRGGLAASLTSVNETPLAREIVFETDLLRFKLGDGSTPWNSLPYVTEVDNAVGAGVTTRAPSQEAVRAAIAAAIAALPQGVPLEVAAASVFAVPSGYQVLFKVPVRVLSGGSIRILGAFVQV